MAAQFVLPSSHRPKAHRYMRSLRRAVLRYWYATMEDLEAAAIEATGAASIVNTLDEAVFQAAHGTPYKEFRKKARLGRVVTGLELIRNCEAHAPVIAADLLRVNHMFGVPLGNGGQAMRSVYTWAPYLDLPVAYREVSTSASQRQRRARAEAQHGYRNAVEARWVMETLLDALAFFEGLDPSLLAPSSPAVRWSFAPVQIPDTDPDESPPSDWYIAVPQGLDGYELYLPDLACRSFERRSARWPAADAAMRQLIKQSQSAPPAAESREITARLEQQGRTIGYAGRAGTGPTLFTWVETSRQVWRDVRRGYRYWISKNGTSCDLSEAGHERLEATNHDGQDLLADLPIADEVAHRRLKMVTTYPDLYLRTRRDR